MKIKWKTILKTVVSLGLLGFLVSQIDLHQLWLQLQHLSLPFILFALLYYTGCQWLSCIRWQIILRSTLHSLPMKLLISSYFAGMFLNTFLPGAVGGDVYRVYQVAKVSRDSEVAFVSVFLERITGVFALLAIALIGLPPAFKLIGQWDIIALLLGCTVTLTGGVLLMSSPRLLILVEPWLERLRMGKLAARFARIQILLRKFAQNHKALALTLGLSVVLQFIVVYYYFLIAQQLNIAVSYLELLVFTPIVTVISLLPISLGGLGLKEGVISYLFTRIGLTVEQALLLSLIITALGWLLSLPGALVLLFDSTNWRKWQKTEWQKTEVQQHDST